MNEQRFSGKGEVYAKGRPGYPPVLFDWLLDRGFLTKEDTVADIGAGTGLFTLPLSRAVRRVYAVEPNEDMRRAGQALLASCPQVVSVSGNAEDTTLPDGAVDAVTAAQAFHWFDPAAFRRECLRILKPQERGRVILVWNDRDQSAGIVADNFAVNREFCPRFVGSSNGADLSPAHFAAFFERAYETAVVSFSLSYDREAFLRRSLSSSYAPSENDAAFAPYVQALGRVFGRYSCGGTAAYPYVTRVFAGDIR